VQTGFQVGVNVSANLPATPPLDSLPPFRDGYSRSDNSRDDDDDDDDDTRLSLRDRAAATIQNRGKRKGRCCTSPNLFAELEMRKQVKRVEA